MRIDFALDDGASACDSLSHSLKDKSSKLSIKRGVDCQCVCNCLSKLAIVSLFASLMQVGICAKQKVRALSDCDKALHH